MCTNVYCMVHAKPQRAGDVTLLQTTILKLTWFTLISNSQNAVVQGRRRKAAGPENVLSYIIDVGVCCILSVQCNEKLIC